MMKLFFYLIMLIFMIFINKKFMMNLLLNMIFIFSFIYMLSFNFNDEWMLIYYFLGCDMYSMMLGFLTIWIFGLMIYTSMNFKNLKFYVFVLMFLFISLILSFFSMNYFLFYLFFEISLIPTFTLIMGWGYQPERINASMYMLIYTLFASLPLMILLFNMFDYFNSLNYLFMLNNIELMNFNMFIIYFYMLFAFLMKLPMFLFHLWLPKAHIEAPVTGSMILAAVLLKLGSYGLLRSMMMMLELVKLFNYLLMGLNLFGMIYLSLLSLRCMDMKLIVAYSSVVHMGMMLMGMLSMSKFGFFGGFIMMVGHGFCSSAMFLMVNMFYECTKSRMLMLNKGMIMFFPNLIMWWFMFCVINMAAPISLNLLSEIFIIMSLFNWNSLIMIFLGIGMYFSAMYSLYLFSYVCHGMYVMNLKYKFKKLSDYMILLIHWLPLNFLILKLEIFI